MSTPKAHRPARDDVSNVAAVVYDIEQLARAVYHHDGVTRGVTVGQIANVLEIALKTRIGLLALGETRVDIDLGDGHVLTCQVRPKEH